NILSFRPVQNKNLSWIASILEYKAPILLMIATQVVALIIFYLSYRYLSYLWIQGKKILKVMIIFLISGTGCSFIDVVFWGGSIDFIRLFDWFTFDIKDVYLDIGIAFLLLFIVNYYVKVYHKMDKEERKQTGISIWLKKGMP
ncbi:MAG: signal peptidase II, partial [Clostridiales bacterium]|nr:signal peptidase II [Clostridiales bacterium]